MNQATTGNETDGVVEALFPTRDVAAFADTESEATSPIRRCAPRRISLSPLLGLGKIGAGFEHEAVHKIFKEKAASSQLARTGLMQGVGHATGSVQTSARPGFLFGKKLNKDSLLDFLLRSDKSLFNQADVMLSHLYLALVCDHENGSAAQRITSEDWAPAPSNDQEANNEGFEGNSIDYPTDERHDQQTNLNWMDIDWTKSDLIAAERGRDDPQDAAYTDNDVLLGRGGGTNRHVGNKHFREEIEVLEPLYEAQTKQRKTEMRDFIAVMNDIKGRRIMVKENGGWVEAPQAKKLKKISQQFRDSKERISCE